MPSPQSPIALKVPQPARFTPCQCRINRRSNSCRQHIATSPTTCAKRQPASLPAHWPPEPQHRQLPSTTNDDHQPLPAKRPRPDRPVASIRLRPPRRSIARPTRSRTPHPFVAARPLLRRHRQPTRTKRPVSLDHRPVPHMPLTCMDHRRAQSRSHRPRPTRHPSARRRHQHPRPCRSDRRGQLQLRPPDRLAQQIRYPTTALTTPSTQVALRPKLRTAFVGSASAVAAHPTQHRGVFPDLGCARLPRRRVGRNVCVSGVFLLGLCFFSSVVTASRYRKMCDAVVCRGPKRQCVP